MNKRLIVKSATRLIVSTAVGTFTGHVIKRVIPEDISRFKKVALIAGGSLTGLAVSSFVQQDIEEQIDTVFDLVDEIRAKLLAKKLAAQLAEEDMLNHNMAAFKDFGNEDKEETKADD